MLVRDSGPIAPTCTPQHEIFVVFVILALSFADCASARSAIFDNATGVFEAVGFFPNGDLGRAASISRPYMDETGMKVLLNVVPSQNPEYSNIPVILRNRATKTSHLISPVLANLDSTVFVPCGLSANGSVAYLLHFPMSSAGATNLARAELNPDGSLSRLVDNWLFSSSDTISSSKIDATCYASGWRTVSADGRSLIFRTKAQLSPLDTDSDFDCYVYDYSTNTTTLITTNASLIEPQFCTINAAGTFAAFNDVPRNLFFVVPVSSNASDTTRSLKTMEGDDLNSYFEVVHIDAAGDNASFQYIGDANLDPSAPATSGLVLYNKNFPLNITKNTLNDVLGNVDFTELSSVFRNDAGYYSATIKIPANASNTYTWLFDSNTNRKSPILRSRTCAYADASLCTSGTIEDYMYSTSSIGNILSVSSDGNVVLYYHDESALPAPGTPENLQGGYYIFKKNTNETHKITGSTFPVVDQNRGVLSLDGRFAYFVKALCQTVLYRWDITFRVLEQFPLRASRSDSSAQLSSLTLLFLLNASYGCWKLLIQPSDLPHCDAGRLVHFPVHPSAASRRHRQHVRYLHLDHR